MSLLGTIAYACHFATNLRAARKARGLAQGDLAKRVGVSRREVSRWENGAEVPHIRNVLTLCRVLGTTPGDLLFMEPLAFRAVLTPRDAAAEAG